MKKAGRGMFALMCASAFACAASVWLAGLDPAAHTRIARAAPHADTIIPGAFYGTSVTWTLAGSPYILQNFVYVTSGGRLTIEPGVVVKSDPGAGIQVQAGGQLDARGTVTQIISFTSDAVSPQPGDWSFIDIQPNASGQLSHCDIAYGAANGAWAGLFIEDSAVSVDSCRIHHGANDGVRLWHDEISPTLTNLTIDYNLASALRQTSLRMAPRFDHVVLQHNGYDGDILDSNANGAQVINGRGYTLDGTGLNGAPLSFADMTIDNGSIVTVTPGTKLEIAQGGSIGLGGSGATLIAIGTAQHPITITSVLTNPQPGAWLGISVHALARLRLGYCEVGFGGNPSNGAQSAIRLNGSDAIVDHCFIHGSATYGILSNSAVQPKSIMYNTLAQNQGWGICGAILNLRYNSFRDNGAGGVCNANSGTIVNARQNYWGDPSGPYHPTLNPTGRGITVSDYVQFDPWLSQPAVDPVLFDPPKGGNVGTTTVRFYSIGTDPQLQLALRRAAQSDVLGTYRGLGEDGGVDYTFNLSGTTPGAGRFIIVGSPQPTATIPATFTVVSAPPDAVAQATDKIFVELNSRVSVHVGSKVPVYLTYGNNGLVDTPPTEFKVYAQSGLSVRLPQNGEFELSLINAPGSLSSTMPSANTFAYEMQFMRPGLRPGTSDQNTLTFVPTAVGTYQYQVEWETSPEFAPVYQQPKDASLQLSAVITSVTATLMTGSFNLHGNAFDGGGTLSVERLGPTDYFTPTVDVITSGNQIKYVITSAVPAVPAALSARAAGTANRPGAAPSLEKIKEVLDTTKEFADKIKELQDKFTESESMRLRRLLMVSCLLQQGVLKTDQAGLLRVQQLGNFGDAGKLASNLNIVLQELLARRSGPTSGVFSQALIEAEAAVNALWDISLQADLQPRLILGELEDLRTILGKQNHFDGEQAANFQVVNSEELQRGLLELCYKKSPKIRHIASGSITAYDPNDKSGSRGEGPTYMVHPDETLSYAIAFENVPTATAPAQVVIISDTIDTSKLDLGTLRLGPVIFSDTIAVSGPGVLPFVKDIDLRPQRNLTVRLEADTANGNTLVWRLTSLDPGTDEIPLDALNGFLRPNQNGSEGQGYVFFSIRPKAGLPMRTLISNTATIVFDHNAPMQTPTWTNEIWHTETYLPLVRK